MDEPRDAWDVTFCPGCGRSNAVDADFCIDCRAPLSSHATTDPVLSTFARGYAARRALSDAPHPIILIGFRLWMGLFAILSLVGSVILLATFLYGIFTLQIWPVVAALAGALPTSILLYISSSMLYRSLQYRVTRKDRGKNVGGSVGQPESAGGQGAGIVPGRDQEENGEKLTCLACGQPMAAGAVRCAGCGWSFADGTEDDSGPEAAG
jgi:hypothetical protein